MSTPSEEEARAAAEAHFPHGDAPSRRRVNKADNVPRTLWDAIPVSSPMPHKPEQEH